MSSSGAEPEQEKATVHGLDVSNMSANFTFSAADATTGEGGVNVTVNVTGGTTADVTGFNLYGANNSTHPSTIANDRLAGPDNSPTTLSGNGTWKKDTAYTIEVSYTRATGTPPNRTTSTVTYFGIIPSTSLNTLTPAAVNGLTLGRRP